MLLDLREGDHEERDAARVFRHFGGQFVDLLFGPLARVGRGGEVDADEVHAALRHHVGGDGAVDAAREQDGRSAGRADGHAAGAEELGAVDVGVFLTHFDGDADVRMVDIHLEVRVVLEQVAAQFPGDLRALQREVLVGALRLDLEGLHFRELIFEVLAGHLDDLLHVLRRHDGAGEPGDAEDFGDRLDGSVHVRVFLGGDDVDGGLGLGDVALQDAGEFPAQVLDEHVFKGAAVEPLQSQLSVFDEQDFFHVSLF